MRLDEKYAVGDCVLITRTEQLDTIAKIIAFHETSNGAKNAEVRIFYHYEALMHQIQEAIDVQFENPLGVENLPKLLESNQHEVVDVQLIVEKVVVAYGECYTQAAYTVIGIYDVEKDRVEKLPMKPIRAEETAGRSLCVGRQHQVQGHPIDPQQAQCQDTSSQSHTDVASVNKIRDACQELLLSSAPSQTTARCDERDIINSYLQFGILNGQADSAMYISGLPGTGKTSIVREVLRDLELEREHEVLPPFVWTEVNGLHLPKPEMAYSILWKALTGVKDIPRSFTQSKLCQALAFEFEHGTMVNRPIVVLVLDEMDFLVTGKSVVLYNILEWQRSPNARLIVVGIANTMDLPERLPPKLRSRLGSNRLVFSSYTAQQLESIVQQRVRKFDVFCADTIHLCCKNVAHSSGDARHVLTLCRRAAEKAIQRIEVSKNGIICVTPEDLHAAQSAASVAAPLIRLRDCRKYECVFLIALRIEIQKSVQEEAEFEHVLNRFAIICNTQAMTPVPVLRDLLLMCEELKRAGLIGFKMSRSSRYPKLSLWCSSQEIVEAFLLHPIGRQLVG